jgi:hypothetical protein
LTCCQAGTTDITVGRRLSKGGWYNGVKNMMTKNRSGGDQGENNRGPRIENNMKLQNEPIFKMQESADFTRVKWWFCR